MKRNAVVALAVAFAALVVVLVVTVASRHSAPTVVEAAGIDPAAERAAAANIARMAASGDIHAGHAMDEMRWAAMPQQAAAANMALPADDMGAKARLASSPRKGQYVKIDVGGTPMTTWVVEPQGSGPAPVVVVIQEIFGLSDWIRGVADQLAAEGFIAVAPDLLSGKGPNGGDTLAFGDNQQQITQATMQIPAAELTAKLKAAREWGLKQPRANGKSASVGFCFGGAQSFAFATAEPGLNAAVVYYGQAPADAAAAQAARG
ncbi:MAG TPA: dienelactone hydrolase family protein, partial [Vicinamibacterales bacterium]|nr:dienelactone hydrolase family protein [Vicinamibacterales bacterium]